MSKIKLNPNINYNFFIILFILVLISCDNYKYQKIRINCKQQKIEILSDEYVFDSIIIENNDIVFYSAHLIDKKEGCSVLYLNEIAPRKYIVDNEKISEMCYEKYNNGMMNFNVIIRNKKYNGTSKSLDKANIQKFNLGTFPCGNQVIILNAIGRH